MRFFCLLLLTCGVLHASRAQYTLTGLQGMVNVPEASVLEEATFLMGMHTNAQEYLLIDYGDNRLSGDEYISVASVGFYQRFSVTFMLSRIFGDPKQSVGEKSSIGDRSMQLTYLAVKERNWIPAVAVNVTDPLFSSNQYLAGNHVVASKTFWKDSDHVMKATAGYGLPYLLAFKGQEGRELQKKESDFLTGFFGGVRYCYVPWHLNAAVEYDGWTLNTGIGAVLWKRLSLQGYLQGFRYPGIGVNFQGKIH